MTDSRDPAAERTSLTIVRRIKAPPARVYAALTDPEQMTHWWSPDAGPVLSAEPDVRPGGRFSGVFRTDDGEEQNCSGTYISVEENTLWRASR